MHRVPVANRWLVTTLRRICHMVFGGGRGRHSGALPLRTGVARRGKFAVTLAYGYLSNSLASALLSPKCSTATSILWAMVSRRLHMWALGLTGLWQMRTKVPGVWIPDDIVERLAKTPKEQKVEEGKRICIEIIQQVREIEGVHGVHVMAFRQEEAVAEIIQRAGLFPRRSQRELSRSDSGEILIPETPAL